MCGIKEGRFNTYSPSDDHSGWCTSNIQTTITDHNAHLKNEY